MVKAKKKTRGKLTMILAFAMVLQMCFGFNVAKAYKEGDVIASFTYADGVTRYLTYGYSTNNTYGLCYDGHVMITVKEAGFDKYGTIWMIDDSDDQIVRFTIANPYDYGDYGYFSVRKVPYYYNESEEFCFENVNSLVYDENKYVVGFKTSDDLYFDILNLEDQNEIIGSKYKYARAYDFKTYLPGQEITTGPAVITNTPEPTEKPTQSLEPVPDPAKEATPSLKPTEQPAEPSMQTAEPSDAPGFVPTQAPDEKAQPGTALPVLQPTASAPVKTAETATPTPASTKKSTGASKVKTTKNGYKVLYTGTKVVGKYKVKSSKLTYNGKTYKNIKSEKSVGFIKKSGHVVYLSKKGEAFLIKGKTRKTLLKKGAKKLIFSGNFVIKIKKTNGKTISVKGR